MLLMIVGLLFSVGFIYNLFVSGNITNAIIELVISLIIFAAYSVKIIENRKSKKLITWIERNKEDICNERASYNGIKITPETELVQFQTCMSVLIASFKIPSAFYIEGYQNISQFGALHSLVSFIFGWWSFPWGPILTIKVIIKNLKGGKRTKVNDFLK